ncbi:Rhamnan synthesis protein F [Rhizobiales bacterium GAS113]|nr:Rhamnan synthesis protein F [Rhizobiales bacterium GAS113]
MTMRSAWRYTRFRASVVAGHLRRMRPTLLGSWTGGDPNSGGNRWAVYAHYSRQGRVFDYVLHALKALCDEGYRIIFVTNSSNFDSAQIAAVAPWCAKILKRRNIGYDFGAYKEGILNIDDYSTIESLILMNDSVYGPLFPLGDTLDRMSSEKADIWGFTDSWEHAYRVQSYFYCFNRRILASPHFHKFWRGIPLINYKRAVIERLEIELTQFFLDRGYHLTAAFPYNALVDRFMSLLASEQPDEMAETELESKERLRTHFATGSRVNSTHYFWDILINEFRYPFIKGELLSQNPSAVYGVHRWYNTISKQTEYDPDLIVEHLKHSQRPRLFGIVPHT